MSSVVTCQCGQQFEAADFLAGREVPCPACGHSLLVPAQEEEVVDLKAAEPITRISVACQCGKRFKALPIYLNRMLPCPACGNHMLVTPAPPEAPKLIPLGPLPMNSSLGNYGDGLGQAMSYDPMSAGYGGPSYGPSYSSPWAAETSSSRRGGSFELGPRAMTALIACGVGTLVLLALAIIVPQLLPSRKAVVAIAPNSPAPPRPQVAPNPTNPNQGVVNTPPAATSPPQAAVTPAPNSKASSSGSWWDIFSPTKKWATFSSPVNPISIDFPGTPQTGFAAKMTFAATPGIENPATLILSDGNEFAIASIRLPTEVADVNVRKQAINEIVSATSREPGTQLLARRDFMLGEHPGVELQCTQIIKGKNYKGTARFVVSRQFVCMSIAIGPTRKFNEEDARRFSESMRITGR